MSKLLQLFFNSSVTDKYLFLSRSSLLLPLLAKYDIWQQQNERDDLTLFAYPSLSGNVESGSLFSARTFQFTSNISNNKSVLLLRYLFPLLRRHSVSASFEDFQVGSAVPYVQLATAAVVIGSRSLYALPLLLRQILPEMLPSTQLLSFEAVEIADATCNLIEDSSIECNAQMRETVYQMKKGIEEGNSGEDMKLLLLTVLDCGVFDYEQRSFSWTTTSEIRHRIFSTFTVPDLSIFLSGEPLEFSNSVRKDLLINLFLSTIASSATSSNSEEQSRSFYLPTVAASFTEMNDWNPSALLFERGRRWAESVAVSKIQGVGYLYYNCRSVREAFFVAIRSAVGDYFDGKVTVEALGACDGRQMHQVETFSNFNGRFSREYLDTAVSLLTPFRFSVAFENKQIEGYITEKISVAFLAQAVC